MTYPTNHKTVFVLDHTPYFGISTENPLDFDCLKPRGQNLIPLPPICKSLWTTSIESATEYCRIVWDLFPTGKLIRFVVSDHAAHILNTWNPQQQNLAHIMNGMAIIGIPPRHQTNTDFSVIHGLRVAIEALTECTENQSEKRTSSPENANKLLNRGRVICITSARDDLNMKSLENIFVSQLTQQNKLAVASDHLIPISHCHLVILNIFPNNIESQVTSQELKEVSQRFSMEVHSMKAPCLHAKLSYLILSHYELASTTVTGIPMKEEQNASSSANYDVEIFHSNAAHVSILKGNPQDSALVKTYRRFDAEGSEYETVTLKWCTPRGCTANELQNCTAMHRITPVDVNSRPSSCLINFLLNGRSVMLEMARKGGGKAISHLLASHGGEIFIHTLSTTRSVLEDPPSISEGCGGRVTDYRITDFGILMRNDMLVALKPSESEVLDGPIEMMRSRLERHTKYWPVTISNTIMFNLRQLIDPLPNLMVKDVLTKDEVLQCKQVIFGLLQLEAKHEPLPIPGMTGTRGGKGQGKRDEHYKLLWSEIEKFLKSHTSTSPAHAEVLACLLEVRNKDDKDKVDVDQALRELDGLGKDDANTRATVIRATTDSPMSPPPCTNVNLMKQVQKNSIYSTKSLLDIWLQRAPKDKRPEMHGRVISEGFKCKLYPNLKEVTREPREPVIEG